MHLSQSGVDNFVGYFGAFVCHTGQCAYCFCQRYQADHQKAHGPLVVVAVVTMSHHLETRSSPDGLGGLSTPFYKVNMSVAAVREKMPSDCLYFKKFGLKTCYLGVCYSRPSAAFSEFNVGRFEVFGIAIMGHIPP